MDNELIERLRESMCRDNMGCMPEVCICAVAEEAADRIEALEAAMCTMHNFEDSRKIEALEAEADKYHTKCVEQGFKIQELEAALREVKATFMTDFYSDSTRKLIEGLDHE